MATKLKGGGGKTLVASLTYYSIFLYTWFGVSVYFLGFQPINKKANSDSMTIIWKNALDV